METKRELEIVREKLFSVEEKWIKNEIGKKTFGRWYNSYIDEAFTLQAAVERLTNGQNSAYAILEKNLDRLTVIRHLY